MDTGDDSVATARRPFGALVVLLLAFALTACAVPLNKEDMAAYKRQQAEKSGIPAQTQSATPPTARSESSGSLASSSVERAPVAGVTREPLSPAPVQTTEGQEPRSVEYGSGGAKLAQDPIHIVAAGDTVYGISRQFGVDPKAVISHNDLRAPYTLSVGQEIKIPQPPPALHRVEKGQTVYGIARQHDVPLRELIDANGLVPPYLLAIGQELAIPTSRRHQVAKGETVYSIARRYEIEQSELVRLNRIEAPYRIKPSQSLVLPTQKPPLPVARETRVASTGSSEGGSVIVKSARASLPPAAIPKPPPRAAQTFLWPVSGPVILGYGPKKDGRHNDGINISAPRGTPVRAAENGVVAYAGNELRGFGNLLLVKHAGGWVTAYAHTEGINVRRGDMVKRGQTIGKVGSSGNVAEPQLHFEVRKGTRAVNPSKLLGPRTAAGQ